MAVDPKEIPGGGEVAGDPGDAPVIPSEEPTEPELPQGYATAEEFERLQEQFNELRSIEQTRAADAEGRAEESDRRAELALRYAEDVHKKQVRDGERWLASLEEEEQAKQRTEFEAWLRDDEARLQRIRDEVVNVPSRERRKVAQKFGIDVKELGDLEDPIEMYDTALEVLKAKKKKEPEKPPEPETPEVTATRRRVGPIQPTGGAPPPAPPVRITSEDVRAAGQRGDKAELKRLTKALAEQRKKDEEARV